MASHATQLGEGPLVRYGRTYVWEIPVRLTHWANAISIPALVVTGLLIARPQLTPVGEPFTNFWMGRVREVHFIFANVLVVSVLLRLYWFFLGNKYARSGFPFVWRSSWWKAAVRQLLKYTRPERGQLQVGHNALAGATYAVFFAMSFFQVFTGFALFSQVNPGGFWDHITGWVIPLFGGPFQTQMWHHVMAWGIVVYVIFHVYIVLYDSQLYGNGLVDAIISGFKFYEKGDVETGK